MQRRRAAVAAVAALDEPTRGRIYDFVVRRPHAVSRDDVAAATGIPRATAAFHLDRLVALGLLDVRHERRSGRRGPGAGRPAKVYLRSAREVDVSLPERRYDLVGGLLAASVEEAARSGGPVVAVLERRAFELGRALAGAADATGDEPPPAGARSADGPSGSAIARATVLRVLEAHGYEPRIEGDDVALGNCPFHVLAREHTELVCGTNLQLLAGVLDGLTPTGLAADLRPGTATCCVRLVPGPPSP